MHPQKPTGMLKSLFKLQEPLSGSLRIADTNVPIELGANGVMKGLRKPFYHVLFEPGYVLLIQGYLERSAPSLRVVFIRKHDPFKLERDHSALGIVGHKESAVGVVEIVGIVGTVLLDCLFDPFPFSHERWRSIDWRIHSRETAQG